MKKKTPKELSKNSLDMRNLVRHKMPPCVIRFKDKKREASRKGCRDGFGK